MHLRVVLAVVVAAAAAVAGCGSDDDASGPADVTAAETAGGQIDAISGEEICERLTVASVAADTGLDVVVQINDTVAGDGAETQEVSAGDNAIRLSGTSLHLGVVQLGDRVLTLIIPVDDVNSDGVDSLIATMATTLD